MVKRQIIGTFDIVMTYDDELIGDKELMRLMDDIKQTIDSKYKNVIDIFAPSHITDSKLYELEGLINLAKERFLSTEHHAKLINSYLTRYEADRYYEILNEFKGGVYT